MMMIIMMMIYTWCNLRPKQIVFLVLYVDGNILTGAIPTEMQKLHKIRMLNIGKTLESYRNDYFFCHIHGMDGLNISLIQSCITIGKNTLAGAVSKLVKREPVTNFAASDIGCTSFPNPLAKMSLHWIGQEKRSEDTLFESLTTLVLGKLLEC